MEWEVEFGSATIYPVRNNAPLEFLTGFTNNLEKEVTRQNLNGVSTEVGV